MQLINNVAGVSVNVCNVLYVLCSGTLTPFYCCYIWECQVNTTGFNLGLTVLWYSYRLVMLPSVLFTFDPLYDMAESQSIRYDTVTDPNAHI